jgi:ParB-like chromosome segregation protein Spo0J
VLKTRHSALLIRDEFRGHRDSKENTGPDEIPKPYANNARTHSKRQIRQVAKSIERFGFCNPILIDGPGTMIAGHGRVAAAKQLGISVVPTVRLSHLSEAAKRAYILADNRLALAKSSPGS